MTSEIIIKNLFPEIFIVPKIDLIDLLNPKTKENSIENVLLNKNRILTQFTLYSNSNRDTQYIEYLQFPNKQIERLAFQIVGKFDSDDIKAEKIVKWVQDNVEYISDLSNYGRPEYWAFPTQTISKKSGDCEDGAFLIHSLLLNSGVSYSKIRTYAGYVKIEDSIPFNGHAWTSYLRKFDNQWVNLDWCYNPNKLPISERVSLKEDKNYADSWWYLSIIGRKKDNNWGVDLYV